MKFKLITKQKADLLTGIEGFDPYAGEQVDGRFPIADYLIEMHKDTDQFKLIDWENEEEKDQSELDFKHKIIL